MTKSTFFRGGSSDLKVSQTGTVSSTRLQQMLLIRTVDANDTATGPEVGDTVLTTEDLDQDQILHWVVACKNHFFDRGEHSSRQLKFGKNPRLARVQAAQRGVVRTRTGVVFPGQRV